ncbi:hypothetical protein [uncultured Tenacibaculum sp.]|nr:hypothetical protein [uncultured Tenacibaculum sp.]
MNESKIIEIIKKHSWYFEHENGTRLYSLPARKWCNVAKEIINQIK